MYKRKRYSQETIVEVDPGYRNAFEKTHQIYDLARAI